MVSMVLSLWILSGCENKEMLEKQEKLIRVEERNKQLVEELSRMRKNIAVTTVREQGKEYLSTNAIIGLVGFLNVVWLILYIRKGKGNA